MPASICQPPSAKMSGAVIATPPARPRYAPKQRDRLPKGPQARSAAGQASHAREMPRCNASMPPETAELLDERPTIDPGTARLIRAAVSSRYPRQMRLA